jgi:hypothetical protein
VKDQLRGIFRGKCDKIKKMAGMKKSKKLGKAKEKKEQGRRRGSPIGLGWTRRMRRGREQIIICHDGIFAISREFI